MYRPIEFAKNFNWNIFDFIMEMAIQDGTATKQQINELLQKNSDIKELFKQIESDGFPYKKDNIFYPIQSALLRVAPMMFGANANYVREYRETFSFVGVAEHWMNNKQVLKLDDYFIEELYKTDNLKIPHNIDTKLPFDCFCIDFSENNIFKDNDFTYVYITKTHGNLVLYIYRIVDEVFFPLKLILDKTEEKNGEIFFTYERADIPEDDDLKVAPHVEMEYQNRTFDNSNFSDFCIFIVQLIMYLSATNKDMKISSASKNSYNPNHKDKSSFKTVQQWDVGYVVGKTIKMNKQKIKRAEKEHKKRATSGTHKTPIPHLRRAHWQRYHVGEGRTETVVKWKEPTFVGLNGLDPRDAPAVIHKVK